MMVKCLLTSRNALPPKSRTADSSTHSLHVFRELKLPAPETKSDGLCSKLRKRSPEALSRRGSEDPAGLRNRAPVTNRGPTV